MCQKFGQGSPPPSSSQNWLNIEFVKSGQKIWAGPSPPHWDKIQKNSYFFHETFPQTPSPSQGTQFHFQFYIFVEPVFEVTIRLNAEWKICSIEDNRAEWKYSSPSTVLKNLFSPQKFSLGLKASKSRNRGVYSWVDTTSDVQDFDADTPKFTNW